MVSTIPVLPLAAVHYPPEALRSGTPANATPLPPPLRPSPLSPRPPPPAASPPLGILPSGPSRIALDSPSIPSENPVGVVVDPDPVLPAIGRLFVAHPVSARTVPTSSPSSAEKK